MREKIKRYIWWCEKTADSNIWNLIEEKYAGWIIGITSIIVFHWSARATWNAFDLNYSSTGKGARFIDHSAAERYFVGLFPLAIALITGGIIVSLLWMSLKSPLESLKKRFREWRKPKTVRLTLHDVDNLTGNRETRRHPPR